MNKHTEEITPDRLIDAATAVMLAVVEISEELGEVQVSPPELMGTPRQPRCLCDFTRYEVAEATAFLIRLGYLERVHRPNEAA